MQALDLLVRPERGRRDVVGRLCPGASFVETELPARARSAATAAISAGAATRLADASRRSLTLSVRLSSPSRPPAGVETLARNGAAPRGPAEVELAPSRFPRRAGRRERRRGRPPVPGSSRPRSTRSSSCAGPTRRKARAPGLQAARAASAGRLPAPPGAGRRRRRDRDGPPGAPVASGASSANRRMASRRSSAPRSGPPVVRERRAVRGAACEQPGTVADEHGQLNARGQGRQRRLHHLLVGVGDHLGTDAPSLRASGGGGVGEPGEAVAGPATTTPTPSSSPGRSRDAGAIASGRSGPSGIRRALRPRRHREARRAAAAPASRRGCPCDGAPPGRRTEP